MTAHRRLLIWLSVVVLIAASVGLIFLLTSSPDRAPLKLDGQTTQLGWSVGPEDARITLVVYDDLQCPACARYHVILKQLRERLPGNVRLNFRHFPLKRHANAFFAALCTEAAGRQGKFWEMQDLLYEKQREWATKGRGELEKVFRRYAESLGLDVGQFTRDLYAPELIARVQRDKKSGEVAGVKATPTIFLNNIELQRLPPSYEAFRRLLAHAP